MIEYTNKEFPQNLQNNLENVIKKEGFIKHEVEKKQVPFDGGSLLSNQFIVTVRGQTEHGEKESYIFVKGIVSLPKSAGENVLIMSQAFQNEAFVYNELHQVFEDLQDEAGVATADRLNIIKSYGESNSEGIFLENISVKGYKSWDRNHTMSLGIAEMALKEIAKFHALTFVVKAKRSEYYKKNIETVKHPITFNEQWEQMAHFIASQAIRHVDGASQEKLEKYLPKLVPKWKEYTFNRSTRTCLCHGDFRLNNLMLKYNGDEVQDLYVVDYQLLNVSCPLNDFFFFIFLSSDQQFRKQHLGHLKDFYYTSLSSFLKKFDLNVEDIYPKREFAEDYKGRLDYGLLVSLYFMPIFFGGKDGPIQLGVEYEINEELVERMQGVVNDYVEWGYL